MESVASFSVTKAGKAYVVNVKIVSAVSGDVGRRFYPDEVIDFNKVLDIYKNRVK